jgi:hypothetical protein
MVLDLQSLFRLLCTAVSVFADTPQLPPSHAFGFIYEDAMVSQDKRHLFVTPCVLSNGGGSGSAWIRFDLAPNPRQSSISSFSIDSKIIGF